MFETILLYNCILLLAVGAAFFVKHTTGCYEAISRTVLFLILLVPAALRYNIGTDYVHYVNIFHSPISLSYLEPGYAAINHAIRLLGGEYPWMFLTIGILTYAPIAFFVRQKWIVPITILFMLTMYLNSYSLIRQFVAITFVLVALSRYMDDHQIGQVYWAIILGALFHKSVLLVLPFVLVRRLRFPIWSILLMLPILFFVLKDGFIESLFNNPIFLQSDYGVYASNKFSRTTEMGSGLGVVLRMIIPLAYIITWNSNEEDNQLLLFCTMAYMLSYVLAIQIHIFNRLTDAFSFAPCLAFASMCNGLKRKAWLGILVVLMGIVFEKTIIDNTSIKQSGLGITPYITLFNSSDAL